MRLPPIKAGNQTNKAPTQPKEGGASYVIIIKECCHRHFGLGGLLLRLYRHKIVSCRSLNRLGLDMHRLLQMNYEFSSGLAELSKLLSVRAVRPQRAVMQKNDAPLSHAEGEPPRAGHRHFQPMHQAMVLVQSLVSLSGSLSPPSIRGSISQSSGHVHAQLYRVAGLCQADMHRLFSLSQLTSLCFMSCLTTRMCA